MGRAIRATSQNPEAAALMGVNVDLRARHGARRRRRRAAGASLYLYPTVGEILIAKCFVIVVLGGLGSVMGAIAAGVLLGLVESLGAVYVSVAYKDTIGFVMFLLVLLRGRQVVTLAPPIAPVLAVLALLALPLVATNQFYLHLAITVLMWTLLGAAWNLLGGFAGQVSFGHAAFFGIGAYTS